MNAKPVQPSVGELAVSDSPVSGASDLHIYRLEPSASPDDPRWENAPYHGVVRVRALSPADARIAAAEAEIDFLDIEAKPGDGTTTDFASAFRADKLYRVVLEDDDGSTRPRGIIQGA